MSRRPVNHSAGATLWITIAGSTSTLLVKMRSQIVLLFLCLAYLVASFLPAFTSASVVPFPEEDELPIGDYIDADLERALYSGMMIKRGCVGRGGNCDHRPNDCCQTTTCKCNLWGANCRCQRKRWF